MSKNPRPVDSSKKNSLFNGNSDISSWKEFFKALIKGISDDNVVIVSGGVAFFFFLALFPAITGIIAIYGLLADPANIQEQLSFLASIFPVEAEGFITERLDKMINQPSEKQGWQLAGSIFLSIWIANIGTRALFKGVSIAYNTEYTRNFFNENKITLLFTAGGMLLNIILIAVLVGFPSIANQIGIKESVDDLLNGLRWPILAGVLTVALSLVYKFAPYQRRSKIKKTISGAAVATLLWIVGSLLLSFMLKRFGIYSAPYGSSLAIIFLMLWCLLISFVILLGAEINSLIQSDNTEADSGE